MRASNVAAPPANFSASAKMRLADKLASPKEKRPTEGAITPDRASLPRKAGPRHGFQPFRAPLGANGLIERLFPLIFLQSLQCFTALIGDGSMGSLTILTIR
jgi:hypothetical protein